MSALPILTPMDIRTIPRPPRELPRKLGLLDSTNIVVGTIIGSAIFQVPSTIAQNIDSVRVTLAIWVLAGVMSMFGALAYAELGAMIAGIRRPVRLSDGGLGPIV